MRRAFDVRTGFRRGRALRCAVPLPPAVAAVLKRAGWDRLDLVDLHAIERLQFRSEGIAAADMRDIERLDPQGIARRDDPAPGRQNEGEHPVKLADPPAFAGPEQMQDGFTVAGCLEHARAKDRAQIGMVVDLPIDDQQIVRLMDRLRAIMRPDDRR